MKKYFIPVLALVLAISSAFTITQNHGTTVSKKWFKFNGSPGQEMTDTKYSVVSAPSCPLTSAAYRYEIYIETQVSNTNLPDLSFAPTSERRKVNP